jgi:hypothetical protein
MMARRPRAYSYRGDWKLSDLPPPVDADVERIVRGMAREEDRELTWIGDNPHRPIIEDAAARYQMTVTSVLRIAQELLRNPPPDDESLATVREAAQRDLDQCLAMIESGEKLSFETLLWVHGNCERWIEYWAEHEPDAELRERFKQSVVEGQAQMTEMREAVEKLMGRQG